MEFWYLISHRRAAETQTSLDKCAVPYDQTHDMMNLHPLFIYSIVLYDNTHAMMYLHPLFI